MYVYDKRVRREACWDCGKVHAAKDCPKVRQSADHLRTARIIRAIREAKKAVGQ